MNATRYNRMLEDTYSEAVAHRDNTPEQHYRVVKAISRSYGYSLQNTGKPLEYIRGANQIFAWYKLKRDAQKRADELNEAAGVPEFEDEHKQCVVCGYELTGDERLGNICGNCSKDITL